LNITFDQIASKPMSMLMGLSGLTTSTHQRFSQAAASLAGSN
jgi:hypothetical protein